MTQYTFMEGKPYTGTEEETMRTIRQVLTEEIEAETPRRARPRALGRVPQAFTDRTLAEPPRRRAADLPELVAADGADVAAVAARTSAIDALQSSVTDLRARLSAFRPTTRHLAIVTTLLLVAVRPHWFVIGAILAVGLTIAVFMTLGADRIWGAVLSWIGRVEARDPARGARLRARLDAFACRWDAILDRLPDGMADDLYMPDFQALTDGDARHERAVSDRLDRMAQES